MKAKTFIRVILLFLICMGGCDIPPDRPRKGVYHSEDLFFTLSHIPKKVWFVLEGECPYSRLESGLERLGFNLFTLPPGLEMDEMRRMSEKLGIEAVLSVNCSFKGFYNIVYWAGRQYTVTVRLIDFHQEKYLWEGQFYGYSWDRAMKQFLKYFEMDIKLINTKLERSGSKQ